MKTSKDDQEEVRREADWYCREWAAIFSFIFLHEKLTEMGYLGAIFILAGVFTAIDAKSTVMELITGKSVAEVTSKR